MSKFRKKPNRHTFYFRVETDAGETTLAHKVDVRRATKTVALVLTADDVRRALEANGVGNTQKCAAALCAKRQAHAFSHPVNGYVDWQYATAFVVSKISKATGLPRECVAYEHSDNTAKLFDTKDGLKKLLAQLEKNGPRTIRLRPITKRAPRPTDTKSKREVVQPVGPREPRIPAAGAKLRFAVARLGL